MPNTELTLYDLSMEGVQIQDLLIENEGELTPELEARLDALLLAGPDKIEAAAMVVRSLEASADVCKNEVERLAKRADSFHANAQRLKDRMAMALDCAFNGKIKTEKFTVWTQAAPEHIVFDIAEGSTIDQVEASAANLVRVKKELDKIACKAAFEAGYPFPPCLTFERTPGKRYLRLK
jgi:hypothetical protein